MKIIIYKLLALLAFATALGLGIVTLHFALGRAKIVITTRETGVTSEINIAVPFTFSSDSSLIKEDGSGDEIKALRREVLEEEEDVENRPDKFSAVVHTLPITLKHTAIPEGEGTEVTDYATGIVTLISELSFPQSLVAKTRLLSPDGILFRTAERVTVPSRGSIDVRVLADQKGKSGDAQPTNFTIPGLSAERQKQVYGKSAEPFTGGARVIKTITENDLSRAESEALAKIKEKAVEEFNASGVFMTSNRVLLNETTFESDDKVGEEKEELSIRASAQAYGVDFDEEILLQNVKDRFAENVPEGRTALGYNEESFTYTLKEINLDEETVIAAAMIEGFITLGEKETVIDTASLAGLSAKEIQAVILKNDAVNAVEVRFSPFWVTRAPRIPEKIIITIQNEN